MSESIGVLGSGVGNGNGGAAAAPSLRALVLDDEIAGRQRMVDMLRERGNVEVVAVCEDLPQARRALQQGGIDVAFLDVRLPEGDGFDALADLPEEERPVLLDLVETIARMRATQALPRLFEFVDREQASVASQALRAIFVLVRERDARAQALVDLADLVRRHRSDEPSTARPPPCSPWFGEYSRYQVLSRLLVEEFNRITGREVGGPEGMYAVIDDLRSEPPKLFVNAASPEGKR